jgi:DNA replication protein DnaC
MERLNDIMMRTAQRRQHIPEQQSQPSSEGTPSQPHGQRLRLPLTRRAPLPEQTGRSSQPVPPQAQQKSTNAPMGKRNDARTHYLQSRSADAAVSSQRDIDRRGAVYYQRPSQPVQMPQGYANESDSRSFGYRDAQEMRTPRRTGDYYDTYPSLPAADVQEDWEEGMRYDDWEDETHPHSPTQRYGYTPVETAFVAPTTSQDGEWPMTSKLVPQQAHGPFATRQLPRMTYQEPESSSLPPHSVHEIREVREVQVPQAQPPAPQALPQEVQHYHRHTQPLHPQTMSALGRDRHEEGRRVQQGHYRQPNRQVVVHESAQQQLPAAIPRPPAPKGVCPKCQGAGYLRIDVPFGHPNFGKPVACECKEAEKKEKRRQELLELSDLKDFRNKSFSNFKTQFPGVHASVQEAFQEASRFAQNLDGWLVLIGPNGCGKTHLAAAIANYNFSNGAVVLFTVVPDLLAHLRSTFGSNATEAYDQRFSKMREAELLILDDLGAHQSSPWASEKLFQLLNYRYNAGFPTVITANRQALTTMDERIQSRLSDTALVSTVIMNGAVDYRRQNPRREPMR